MQRLTVRSFNNQLLIHTTSSCSLSVQSYNYQLFSQTVQPHAVHHTTTSFSVTQQPAVQSHNNQRSVNHTLINCSVRQKTNCSVIQQPLFQVTSRSTVYRNLLVKYFIIFTCIFLHKTCKLFIILYQSFFILMRI